MPAITIIKASGDKEPFLADKIRRSLKRAGAKEKAIDKILVSLTGQLYNNITTAEIYRRVFALFNQYQSGTSFRYNLKQALMALGPSGYPFEKFISRLLEHLGYRTQTQVIVKGRCIDQEIDVVAEKEKQKFLVECKFHNRAGTKTRSRDTLCLQARFKDVKDFNQAWLITNTKLSSNAIKYGQCQRIRLTAWGYPDKDSLEQLIEKNKLYPLTCLSFIKTHELQILIQNNLVLCKDLVRVPESKLKELGLSSTTISGLRSVSFS